MPPRDQSPEDKLAQSAFTLIEREGWTALSMLRLAKASKVKVSELYRIAPDKQHLLRTLLATLDREIIERLGEADLQTPMRDRVFDAVLNAFEAMAPRKPVMRVLYHDLRRDPSAWASAWAGLKQTSRWIADSAGVDTAGMMGALRLRGLAILMADVTPIWLEDTDDLGRTMAHLDARVRRIDKALAMFRQKPKDTAAAETETENAESVN